MTDTSVVDAAGITRTPTGEINNPVAEQGTTGQPKEPSPNTTPTQTPPNSEPKTVLNQEPPKPEGEGEKKEGEPKAEGEKKPEAKTGAPEKYADFKLPEGFTISPEVKTEADALFKSLNLTQEQAQSLVDFNAKAQQKAAEASAKAFADTTAEWLKAAQEHPELRGKLGQGQEVNVRIGRFLAGLNDPQLASDFRKLMDLTGAGNHQAFIRVLDRAAKQLTEGSFVAGNGPAPAGQSRGNTPPPSAAQAMWPNLPNRAQ